MREKVNKKDILIIWVVIIVVALLSFGAMLIYKNDLAEAPSTTQQQPETYAMGDVVKAGAFEYIITDAERNGNLVSIDVRAKNITNKAETVYTGTITLADGKGAVYKHNTDGLSSADINPGIEREGTITFEVPAEVTGLRAAVTSDAVREAFGGDTSYTYIDIGL